MKKTLLEDLLCFNVETYLSHFWSLTTRMYKNDDYSVDKLYARLNNPKLLVNYNLEDLY